MRTFRLRGLNDSSSKFAGYPSTFEGWVVQSDDDLLVLARLEELIGDKLASD